MSIGKYWARIKGRRQRHARRLADYIAVAVNKNPNSPEALYAALSDDALRKTVRIISAEMTGAVVFLDPQLFLSFCLSKATREGAYCEFGVYSGSTINHLAGLRPGQTFVGFDSFKGLPSDWSGYIPFDFDRGGQPPLVRDNVELRIGLFDETLPAYSKEVDVCSFIHIDCDLYSSTATVFKYLENKIPSGCVIVFDEYFCYPGFEAHEFKAFREFLERTAHTANWIAVCGQRAACIIN